MAQTIAFNVPQEFVEELRRDAPAIHRAVVRVTGRRRAAGRIAPVELLDLMASYRRGDEVVRLEYHCGQLWGEGFEHIDKTTYSRAEDARDLIVEAAKTADSMLEVRGGVYQ